MIRPTCVMAAVLGAAALASLSPTSGSAQAVPEVRMTRPAASWEEPLSSIRGLRELADGRVLLSDGIDEVLLRLDLTRGRVDTLGRAGAGPGEYKSPDGLFPLPNGATLLMDLGNGRLSAIDADGVFKDSWSIARGSPGTGPGGLVMILPRAVDGQGRVYFESSGAGPGGARPDSATILRWDRATDRIDTLTKRKLPSASVTTTGGANNQRVMVRPRPLTEEDGWAVTPDGRIGLVRASNYMVEWWNNGGVVRGPANLYRPVRVTSADKQAWIATLGDGIGVMVQNVNGQISTSFRRGGAGRTTPNPNDFEWPETKPAFNAAGTTAAPSGELWVQRYGVAGDPTTYDVFGADGKLVKHVILPAGRRLEGFGKDAIYLSRADDSDLKYLEKYAAP